MQSSAVRSTRCKYVSKSTLLEIYIWISKNYHFKKHFTVHSRSTSIIKLLGANRL